MAIPLSETVMEALLTRLKTISVANGYSRDIDAANIRRMVNWSVGETVPLPSIFLFQNEITEDKDGAYVGGILTHMPVGILYLVEEYGTQATTLNYMRADITKAIGSEFTVNDAASNGVMVRPLPIGSEAGVSDPNVAYVAAGYEVLFEHAWGDESVHQ